MIQLVIEIPQKLYTEIKDSWSIELGTKEIAKLKKSIANSKPLPKGHWIDSQYDKDFSQCSECGSNWEKLIIENCNMDYCPNCGSYNGGN